MGARIEGEGTSRIRIEGVDRLHGARTGSSPIASSPAPSSAPSRRPAATSCCASAARPPEAAIDKLREAGATIEAGDGWIRCAPTARPRAVNFRTSAYPAFPTDMQAQFMALDASPTARRA